MHAFMAPSGEYDDDDDDDDDDDGGDEKDKDVVLQGRRRIRMPNRIAKGGGEVAWDRHSCHEPLRQTTWPLVLATACERSPYPFAFFTSSPSSLSSCVHHWVNTSRLLRLALRQVDMTHLACTGVNAQVAC